MTMRLTCQVLWITFISSHLCIVSPFITDKKSVISTESEPSKGFQTEAQEDDYEDGSGEETETEPSIEFEDFVDLDALAKGVLGSESKQGSVVPCFGTWWPSNGGYVYYYDDNGSDYTNDGGSEEGSDYGRRRRNRRRRRRRMRNRSRRRSRTTARKSTNKKSQLT